MRTDPHWFRRRRRPTEPLESTALTTLDTESGWTVETAAAQDLRQRLDALDHAVSNASRRLAELMNELDLDPATGVLTAPAFLRGLAHLHAGGQGRRHALLHVWVPEFGTINLRHGAAAGSVLMAHLAHLLQSLLRDNDLVGRPAEDELAAAMIDTAPEPAAQRLRVLQDRVAAHRLRHGGVVIAYQLRGAVVELHDHVTAAGLLRDAAEQTRAGTVDGRSQP